MALNKLELPQTGFSAWVVIGKKRAEIYHPECSLDGKSASCWIASIAGETYGVGWNDAWRTVDNIGNLSIDGMAPLEHGRTIFSHTSPRARDTPNGTALKSSIRSSEDSHRPLTFRRIQTTDDDAYIGQGSNIGTIELKIWEREPTNARPVCRESVPEELSVIHEKSKNMSNHSTGFGREISTTRRVKVPVIRRKTLLATFTFKYTSIQLLKAEGIVPTPQSQPITEKNESSDSDDDNPMMERRPKIDLTADVIDLTLDDD